MYNVYRRKNPEYKDCYEYRSKNCYGQTIVCEAYRTLAGYFNFTFYITTKRRDGYQENAITGKDGQKSLLWAKKCLEDFLEFFKSNRWFKYDTLVVYPSDEKRRRVYEYALLPLGFKVMRDKYRSFYYRN